MPLVNWDSHVPFGIPGDMVVPTDRKIKVLTLVIVVEEGKVLLGRKARGFGEGKWNGFGGKVEEGESVEQGAVRELQEESGLVAEKMEKVGVLFFWFESEMDHLLETHLFKCTAYSGSVTESEEMHPISWYPAPSIPYDLMWPDDRFWLPRVVSDATTTPIIGKFRFSNLKDLDCYEIHDVPSSLLNACRQGPAYVPPTCLWTKK